MKFFAVILFCTLLSVAYSQRLPLPVKIQKTFPWMIDEPIGDANSRIVGGSNAGSGEAPHQIALLRSNSFTCGGSFISSRTVLTAAHCVYGYGNSIDSTIEQ